MAYICLKLGLAFSYISYNAIAIGYTLQVLFMGYFGDTGNGFTLVLLLKVLWLLLMEHGLYLWATLHILYAQCFNELIRLLICINNKDENTCPSALISNYFRDLQNGSCCRIFN